MVIEDHIETENPLAEEDAQVEDLLTEEDTLVEDLQKEVEDPLEEDILMGWDTPWKRRIPW